MATTTLQGVTLNGQPINIADYTPLPDPYCYVCGRCTDHVAEHDDLEEAGLVQYEDGGVVAWKKDLSHDNLLQWFGFNLLMSFMFGSDWYYRNRYPTLDRV